MSTLVDSQVGSSTQEEGGSLQEVEKLEVGQTQEV